MTKVVTHRTLLAAIIVLAGFAVLPVSAQRLCEHNDNFVAKIAPCFGSVGTTITITPGRGQTAVSGRLIFKRVLANGVPGQVIAAIANNAVVIPPQLCTGGNGRWEVWLTLSNNQSQGKIGAFTTAGCVGGTSTGLGGTGGGTTSDSTSYETIILPPITMNVDNEVYAKTKSTSQSYIKNIASTLPAIATGTEWGTNEVKIYGKKVGVTTITFTDENTRTLYRVKVTVVKGQQQPPVGGGAAPTAGQFDPCLVGHWTAVAVTDLNQGWAGGTGFTVRFDRDGTQTVDYTRMQPFTKRNDSMTWTGRSTSTITTSDGLANLVKIQSGDLLMKLGAPSNNAPFPFGSSMIGPGGLGGLANGNTYTCSGNTLEYRTTWARDKHANYEVTLRKTGN